MHYGNLHHCHEKRYVDGVSSLVLTGSAVLPFLFSQYLVIHVLWII